MDFGNFPNCSQLFPIVPNRSELFPIVPNRSELFRFVPFRSAASLNQSRRIAIRRFEGQTGLHQRHDDIVAGVSSDGDGAWLLVSIIRHGKM